MSIGLIVGLGNPGPRYANTRHNVGFRLLEAYAHAQRATPWRQVERFNALTCEVVHAGNKLQLMKPLTYMNNSGQSIAAWLRFYNRSAAEVLLAHDDLTLDFGRSKLSTGGSAGGHNGIADILARVESNEFLRYRIGIGAKPHKDMPLADYVLSRLSADEDTLFAQQMDTYCNHILSILNDGPDRAMSHINQRTVSTNEY